MNKKLYYGKRIFSFANFKTAVSSCQFIENVDDRDDEYLYALYTLSYKMVEVKDLHVCKYIKYKNYLAVAIALSIIHHKYIFTIYRNENSDDKIKISPFGFDDKFTYHLYDIVKNRIHGCMDANEKFHLTGKINEMLGKHPMGISYNEPQVSNLATETLPDKKRGLQLYICRLWDNFRSIFLHDRMFSRA